MTSFRRTRPAALAGAAARTLGFVLLATFAVAAGAGVFVFERLNQTYEDPAVAPHPVEWGPFRLRLSIPQSTLTVVRHQVRLTPEEGGTHRFEADGEVEGTGWLVADVDVLGLETRREDRVTLPRQTRKLGGRVSLDRRPDGYLVTPIELPRQLRVTVRSRMAADLVAWCEGSTLLRLAGVGCGGLERALSEISVPLPPPGESYLVPYSELTPEERARLDRYLDTAKGR